MGHMTVVQCGRSHSVTAAGSMTQGVLCASLLRLVDSGKGIGRILVVIS